MSSSQEMTFAMLIAALGNSVGVPDVAPGPDGILHMDRDGKTLSILRQGESAILYMPLGVLPDDYLAALRTKDALLSANVLYRGTYGACLGVAAEDGTITLCFQIAMHSVTEQSFVQMVNNFDQLAQMWLERLAELAAGAPENPDAGATPEPSTSNMPDPLMFA